MKETLVAEAEARIPNLFLLTNVATRRAEQVMEGSVPALTLRATGPIETALQEIAAGRLEPDETSQKWLVKPE